MEQTKTKILAKFIINDLTGILKRKGLTMDENPISPTDLSYMVDLMMEGHLERKDIKLWVMETCDRYVEAKDLVLSFLKDVCNNHATLGQSGRNPA